MSKLTPAALIASTCLVLAPIGSTAEAQRTDKPRDDNRRPRMTVRAQPQLATAPARVVLTGELVGGADDFEEYYCPTIQWEWGDGTSSESSVDCPPYESGKTQIRRRFTTQHVFRQPGNFRVFLHLKQSGRAVGSGSASVQIRPGLGQF
ncbi:MAG: hypothetical protein AB7Q29_11210 [Vicinamibacterales bacterium]